MQLRCLVELRSGFFFYSAGAEPGSASHAARVFDHFISPICRGYSWASERFNYIFVCLVYFLDLTYCRCQITVLLAYWFISAGPRGKKRRRRSRAGEIVCRRRLGRDAISFQHGLFFCLDVFYKGRMLSFHLKWFYIGAAFYMFIHLFNSVYLYSANSQQKPSQDTSAESKQVQCSPIKYSPIIIQLYSNPAKPGL